MIPSSAETGRSVYQIGVAVSDTKQAQDVIAGLLARPEIALVHLRNVGYGCYNFSVRATG